MRSVAGSRWIIFVVTVVGGLALAGETTDGTRILSWNVSDDAFVSHPAEFQALLRRANPDILLLDEVAPSASAGQLRNAIDGLRAGDDRDWNIDVGKSGGCQRMVWFPETQVRLMSGP